MQAKKQHAGGISIHALREEGDNPENAPNCPILYFYPRPPRGGRRGGSVWHKYTMAFLSTPSARRATATRFPVRGVMMNFYPRPPRGGRRAEPPTGNAALYISIHALREEGDPATVVYAPLPKNFYPRPPRGGRRQRCKGLMQNRYFYPRPPRGGRRLARYPKDKTKTFLSTPSARRATVRCAPRCPAGWYFYPRPPRGGRRQ